GKHRDGSWNETSATGQSHSQEGLDSMRLPHYLGWEIPGCPDQVNLHRVHSGRGCDGGEADIESNNGSASDCHEKEGEGGCEHKGG
ncbi:unnamed protein product, partial [Choristocarpus tenellus]